MARRSAKHATHENHERWLVSYADFITLLFAFFVVMFATGQTDRSKAKQVSESVQAALEQGNFSSTITAVLGGNVGDRSKGEKLREGPGGAGKLSEAQVLPGGAVVAELLPSLDKLSRDLKSEIDQGKIQVNLQPRGLVVSLREAAVFGSGQADLLPQSYTMLDKLSEVVMKLPNPIRLEGHTDSIPIHNERFNDNWALSSARSIAMLRLFRERYQIPENRMAVAGYADTIPVDTNDTADGRERNRRVDLVVLNMKGVAVEPKAREVAQVAHH